VIDFVDMHDLGDMLVENGFEIPVMDQETITVTYTSAAKLLADVRRWGAYPFDREAATPHAARRLHRALEAALEARKRADGPERGTIALTFEVIYGHAWKAAPRHTAEGHGIVRIEDIGRGPARNR
jgi:malonyl-CoA O-methyltransferase